MGVDWTSLNSETDCPIRCESAGCRTHVFPTDSSASMIHGSGGHSTCGCLSSITESSVVPDRGRPRMNARLCPSPSIMPFSRIIHRRDAEGAEKYEYCIATDEHR